jgi:ADP-ribose pyrophosphatase
MENVFLTGALAHRPLLSVVLGETPELLPAVLPGHDLRHSPSGPAPAAVPVISPGAAAAVAGFLLTAPGAEAMARLSFFAAAMGYGETHRLVAPEGGALDPAAMGAGLNAGLTSAVSFEPAAAKAGAAPWQQEVWAARWGAIATETAADVMAAQGELSAEALAARRAALLVRAASRLRAQEDKPATLRYDAQPEDVSSLQRRIPYAHFFAVEDHLLRHRRFDGKDSAALERAVFVSCDAVVLLPYDPVRDRVLLIEQFRPGPWARGDRNPWLLEAIAGRIDAGETPEMAARREAGEEAGISLGRLMPGPSYYPSPGAKSEYIYSYLGLADLPDGVAQPGGLEEEGEDIRPHLVGFDQLMDLAQTGEIDNGPLMVLVLFLARERAQLRAAALVQQAEAGAARNAGTGTAARAPQA